VETFQLIFRNVFRHRLRACLTILGVAIALLSFGILRTLVGAWYLGVETSAADRLVTRNKISLIYFLPLAYKNKILQISGVSGIGYGVWYGGVYIDKKNFFPQIAVSGLDYLALFPEFIIDANTRKVFAAERKAAIAGRGLIERFGWKVGDNIPLQGTIFPGNIDLKLAGVYKGARKNVDETAFFFKWEYLNEIIKKTNPDRADKVGWYMVRVKDPDRAAEISQEIDALFSNSLAETLTETEKAFQLGFVAMTEAIIAAVRVISFVVIAIILIVLANTMAMTARERTGEYAVLKTLGFQRRYLFLLIAGESVSIAVIGGILGALLTFPGGRLFQHQMKSFLPVFEVSWSTIGLMLVVSFLLGLTAAIPPVMRIARMGIADGLRHIG
jgi:putative ABC transport system permease protein